MDFKGGGADILPSELTYNAYSTYEYTIREFTMPSNVPKPSNCFKMFGDMSSLTSIDLTNLDTSEVISMSNMFNGCSSLVTLDVTMLNTSKVTNMRSMFQRCSKLETLNLTNFNTENVTDMSYMFANDRSIKELDLTSFSFNNSVYVTEMFMTGTTSGTSIYNVYVKSEADKTYLENNNANPYGQVTIIVKS